MLDPSALAEKQRERDKKRECVCKRREKQGRGTRKGTDAGRQQEIGPDHRDWGELRSRKSLPETKTERTARLPLPGAGAASLSPASEVLVCPPLLCPSSEPFTLQAGSQKQFQARLWALLSPGLGGQVRSSLLVLG